MMVNDSTNVNTNHDSEYHDIWNWKSRSWVQTGIYMLRGSTS